ncbi:MAG TPA: alpha/beta hydrolase [Thermoanaerobaculia bacterium]|nr:alpha/beta hydrolase [Thermoanaerobaculia bacterium]
MRHRRSSHVPPVLALRRLATRLFIALALAALLPSLAVADPGGLRCRKVSFPVTLSPADPTAYEVVGVLCARGSVHGKTIQITLHGATYSHLYWDWPFEPETYSYVRRATAAGYAVLNLDRIGVGESDRPPAAAVTIGANAYVVHQIVAVLRSGNLVEPAFGRIRAGRVALVGHSLGSVISIAEAGTYGDVDGVVLTGVSHEISPVLGETLSTLYPASLDPHFAGLAIPDGYLTSQPGLRNVFYQSPFFDLQVLALDEETKETVTTAELDTAVPALGLSTAIHVPVLVMVGDYDAAFCGAPTCSASGSLAGEPAFYPADACTETAIVPETGHDVNLHFHAPSAFGTILSWMDRRVGREAEGPAPQPCQP